MRKSLMAAGMFLSLVGAATYAAAPAMASASSSATAASPDIPVPVQYVYTAISIQTTNNYTNTSQVLAKCTNPGGSCSITSESSHQTQIGVALGATAGDLAPSLSFNESDSNSTGVTCNTPRSLKSGEVFEAFALGVYKSYEVQKKERGGTVVIATSGRTHGFDPYTYPAISCSIHSS